MIKICSGAKTTPPLKIFSKRSIIFHFEEAITTGYKPVKEASRIASGEIVFRSYDGMQLQAEVEISLQPII